MLKDKLKQTSETIKNVQTLSTEAYLHRKYSRFYADVQSLLPTVQRIEQAAQYLKNDRQDGQVAEVTGIVTLLNGMINQIGKHELPLQDKVEQLKTSVTQVDAQMREKWKTYVQERTRETLNVLHLSLGLFDDPQSTKNVINGLHEVLRIWPLHSNTPANLDELMKQAGEIIAQLQLDDKTQAFLEKMLSGEARVSDMTPDILTWLQNNHYAQNLTLGFVNLGRSV